MKKLFSDSIITLNVIVFLGLSVCVSESRAADDLIPKECTYFSEKYSKYSVSWGEVYKIYYAETIEERQRDKKLMDDYLEKFDNREYQIWQAAERIAAQNNTSDRSYMALMRLAYQYAKLMAITNPGKDKLTYERLIYEECMRAALNAEWSANNSPAYIERMKEVDRLQQELSNPKPQPQQPQNVIVNPSRPLNCTSMPDGPGSTRMITTCF